MAARIALLLLVAACGSASAQLPGPPYVVTDTPRPVVTLGSPALVAGNEGCKAVGFAADGRSVLVFGHTGWHRWDIATGRQVEAKAGILDTADTFHPAPDGKTVLALTHRQNDKHRIRTLDLKTGWAGGTREVDSSYSLVAADDSTAVAVVGPSSALIVWPNDKTPDTRVEIALRVRRFAKAAAATLYALLDEERVTVATPAGLWKLDPPADASFTGVALTADGKTLATASAVEGDNGKRPGPVDLWDVPARKKVRTLAAVDWFAEAPNRLRFTPDGTTLVAGDGAFLRGWNATTGATTFAVEPGWVWVGGIQISPDGRHVAVAYPNRPMVYELATGRQPAALLGHPSPVWEVAVSPDGRRAATAMYGRPTVYVWDTATGQNVGEVQTHFARPADGSRIIPGRVRVQFSLDGTQLLTANEASGTSTPLRVWDAQRFGLLREFPGTTGDDGPAAFTRHGLFAVRDRKPTLLDVTTGRTVWEKPAVARGPRVAVSPDGTRVAVEGRKDTAVWACADGRELDRVPGEPLQLTLDGGLSYEGKKQSPWVRDLDRKADRKVVDSTSEFPPFVSETGLVGLVYHAYAQVPEFRVYLPSDGRLLSTCEHSQFPRPLDAAPSVAFSRDGRAVAVVSTHGSLRCFETYSGQELLRVEDVREVRALTFAPDGRTLFVSHGQSFQVEGYDLTGGAWAGVPVATAAAVGQLAAGFGGKPPAARRALAHLATRPADAIAFAREVTKLATDADLADYNRWLAELDAPAYAVREAASKSLAKGGWRAEAVMRQTLDATESPEVRHRLEKLLANRDMRPLRAVHLLEVVRTSEAVAVLKEIAGGPPGSLVVQDARWSLQRLALASGQASGGR